MSSSAREAPTALGSWRKSISEKDIVLAIQVAGWLKKRGKSLRPKLNDEQKQQLEECFELMDADGSGAIDADELGAAFKLLGLNVKKSEIGQILDEVDSDGSGEVEYPEFIEIMTSTLAKLAEKKDKEGQSGNQVPFALLATAYRRKRIMEGLISGDKEMTAQVVAIAEEAARRAAEEAAAHQAEEAKRRRTTRMSHEGQAGSGNTSSTGYCEDDSSSQESRPVQLSLQSPSSLMKALMKVKSLKINPMASMAEDCHCCCSSTAAAQGSVSSCSCSVGPGGCQNNIAAALGAEMAALLGEDERMQIAELLRLTAQRQQAARTQAAAVAGATSPKSGRSSGRSSPSSASSNGGIAAGTTAQPGLCCEGSMVGTHQHITSKLQQKVLTQEVQLPRFNLSPAHSLAEVGKKSGNRSTNRSLNGSPLSLSSVPSAVSVGGPIGRAASKQVPGCSLPHGQGIISSKSATDLQSLAGAGAMQDSSTTAGVHSSLAGQLRDCSIHEYGTKQACGSCGGFSPPAVAPTGRQLQQNLSVSVPVLTTSAEVSLASSPNTVIQSTNIGRAGSLGIHATFLASPGNLAPTPMYWHRQQQCASPVQQHSKSIGRGGSPGISASAYAAAAANVNALSSDAVTVLGSGGNGGGGGQEVKSSLMQKLTTNFPTGRLDVKQLQQ